MRDLDKLPGVTGSRNTWQGEEGQRQLRDHVLWISKQIYRELRPRQLNQSKYVCPHQIGTWGEPSPGSLHSRAELSPVALRVALLSVPSGSAGHPGLCCSPPASGPLPHSASFSCTYTPSPRDEPPRLWAPVCYSKGQYNPFTHVPPPCSLTAPTLADSIY